MGTPALQRSYLENHDGVQQQVFSSEFGAYFFMPIMATDNYVLPLGSFPRPLNMR